MIADLQRQLGIDASFFPQFLIFVFVFLWLRFVYFKPYLALIQKRENQSEGLSDEAQRLEEESARLEQQYQDSIVSARRRAFAERDRILADARKQASETVANARQAAKSKLEQTREAAQKSYENEFASLKAHVGSVTSMLVEKLTKTRVGL